jgi:ABC-type branched-subunit amino acid transport system substrate-binding protein
MSEVADSRFHVPGARAAAAVLVLWATVLAACSFPGSVKPTVKIGLSAPFEGLYRGLGYSTLQAVRLAVRQRNEAGGIANRYLVELVALNDFNEADEAIRQAAEMAADPGIRGVLGGWSPITNEAAAPEYDRVGLAFLSPGADWVRIGQVAARVATGELTLRKAVLLYSTSPENLAMVDGFTREFTASGGEIAAQGTPSGEGDVARLLTGLGEAPALVLLAADPPTSAGWLPEIRKSAPEALILGGPSLGDSLVPVIAGDASDGVRFVSHLAPPPDGPAFVEGYEGLSDGLPPGLPAGWAWEAANRLLDALEVAARAEGQPTREGVQEALLSQPAWEPGIHVYIIADGVPVLTGSY